MSRVAADKEGDTLGCKKGDNDDIAAAAQYITGFALYIVAAVITMAGFLLLLDSTVLATVSFEEPHILPGLVGLIDIGHSEHHQPIQFSQGYRLVRQRVSYDNVSLMQLGVWVGLC